VITGVEGEKYNPRSLFNELSHVFVCQSPVVGFACFVFDDEQYFGAAGVFEDEGADDGDAGADLALLGSGGGRPPQMDLGLVLHHGATRHASRGLSKNVLALSRSWIPILCRPVSRSWRMRSSPGIGLCG